MKEHAIGSPRAMHAFASRVAEGVLRSRRARRQATVVALAGELGAGKTIFVKGFAKAFHVKHRMPSPTFVIVRSYAIPRRNYQFRRLFHLDFYRIASESELRAVGWSKIMGNPEHLVLVEWADRLPSLIPRSAIWVRIRHGEKGNERSVAVSQKGW